MSFYPLQTGFAGGVVTPRLLGNTDAALYGKSLLECKNWEILPQGSLKLRGGMKHLVTGTAEAARLLPFPRHNAEDLIVELRDDRMRVIDKTGRFYGITAEGSTPAGAVGPDQEYLINAGGVWASSAISDTRLLENLPFLFQVSKRCKVVNGRIRYSMTADREYTGFNQAPKRTNAQNVEEKRQCVMKIPMVTLNAEAAYTVNIGLSLVPIVESHLADSRDYPDASNQYFANASSRNFHEIIEVVSSDGDTAFRQVNHYCDKNWGKRLTVKHVLTGEDVLCEYANDTRNIRTAFTVFEDVVTGSEITDIDSKTWFLKYRVGPINISTYNNGFSNVILPGQTWDYTESSYSLDTLSVEGPGISGADGDGTIDHPFSNIAVQELQYGITARQNLMVLVHGSTVPYQLRVDDDNYIYFGPVPYNDDNVPNGTALPGENPRTATFHLGRLWLGGNNLYPNRLWASRVGDYTDFEIPALGNDDQLTDEDPLQFDLDIRGQINWLFSQQYLFIGTDREEIKGSGNGRLITATNFNFEVQSLWGSAYEMPSPCGPAFAVLARNKRNAFMFNESELLQTGWTAKNLMYHVEHLVDAEIVRIAYTESVNPKLYILLANDKLIVASFDERIPVEAYYVITTEANINDIAVCHSRFGDFITIATTRNSNNQIELIDDSDECYLDGWIKSPIINEASLGGSFDNDYSEDFDVNGRDRQYVEGIQDYANETYQVQVLGFKDGVYDLHFHPPINFDADGRAYLESWSNGLAYVGNLYENLVKTLPLAQGLKGGSALGANRIFSNPVLRMGVGDGEPVINNQQSKLLINGDIKECEVYLDRNETGILTITQLQPKATEIIAIFGKASSGAK